MDRREASEGAQGTQGAEKRPDEAEQRRFAAEIPVKRLKRELAYQGTILKVYRDYVDANGNKAVWDYIHHDGAAAVVPVTEDGRILMVRQYRNALDRFTLEIPAGKVDSPGEPRRLCAFRELEEETGYRVERPEDLEFLMRLNTTVAFCDEELDVFLARNLKKGRQHLDEDEVIEVESWALPDLLQKIWKGELRDAKTAAAILGYAVRCGK